MGIPNPAKEQLEKLDTILDEYESSLGIPKFRDDFHDDSAKQYLQLSRNEIEKLTPEQCAEAALLLASLSFHLQRSYNREIARVNWATTSIKKKVSGRESQYKGSWDSQHYQVVKEDGYISRLESIRVYAQQRADRLTYLSSSVKSIGDIFLSVQRAKAMR